MIYRIILMLKVFTYCTYVLYIKTYSIQSNHQSINASYQRTYGPPPQTSVDPHSRKIKARQVNPHERHTTVPAGATVRSHPREETVRMVLAVQHELYSTVRTPVGK